MNKSLVIGGVALLAGVLGYSLPTARVSRAGQQQSQVGRRSTDKTMNAVHHQPVAKTGRAARSHEVGQDALLKLTLEPDATAPKNPGGGIHATFSADNLRKQNVRFMYAFELVDDFGTSFVAPQISAAQKLDANAAGISTSKLRTNIDVPPGLPDGYYILRVHGAAMTDVGDEDSQLAELYLKVVAGAIEVIDVNKYLIESRARFLVEVTL